MQTSLNGILRDPDARAGWKFQELLYKKQFAEMLRGVYPSFDECIKKVSNGDVKSMAFSREYAVAADTDLEGLLYLFCKQNKVGFLFGNKVTLGKKMQCLKEALTELGVKL